MTERVLIAHDRATGLRCAVVVDDTTRGPALGGVRWGRYPDEAAAVLEARRLAAAMTLKHALAQTPYGGGKAVVFAPAPGEDRDAVLDAFARVVAELDGGYVPGVDMGTSTADLARIGAHGVDVACSLEDPSPWTALGVFAAIEAAVGVRLDRDLAGVRVCVQGAGHVGAALAELLAERGAELLVADLDGARAAAVARATGGRTVAPERALTTACDVLAPCSRARVLDAGAVEALRCRVVAGAANDLLDGPGVAEALERRGVAYVPDFLANAGGVVHIHALRAGWSAEELRAAVLRIGPRAAAVLALAAEEGRTPTAVAEERARRNLRAEVAA